jgi:lysophospholipase L1-like esterase
MTTAKGGQEPVRRHRMPVRGLPSPVVKVWTVGGSMGRVARIVVVTLAVVLAGLVAQPAWAAPPLPSSMAAIGDSITRAYDVCCSYGDHPGQSWSTGSTSYDGISSHYERLRQLNSAIAGRGYNDAVSGAKMAAAPTQAAQAVSQGARYVTILLGANDLCTSSPSTMTSTATFRAQFSQAMATLMAQDRKPYVFVSSIPNIYQLWQVLHTNSLARWVWATARICQSMLGATRTEAERQLVVDRERAFNQILAEVCAQYSRCRWDGGAVYNYRFSPSQVSTLDFFHPSLSGQAALARITWAASWWPSS